MSQEIHNELIRKPWQAWAFIGAFGTLLLGFGASNLLAWRDGGLEKTTETGWSGFSEGKPMQALAEDLRTTPLADWIGQRQREFGWLALHDTGPRVHQGCTGWLFLHDELKVQPRAESNAAIRADIAIRLQRQLAERGTRLLIALVPDKSRIEQDQLCELRRPSRLEPRYDAWLETLRGAGVPVVDLRPALLEVRQRAGAAYDRSDTHWSIEGAKAAAAAMAASARDLGYAPGTPVRIEYEASEPRPRWGDLVRLAGLDGLPEHLRPAPDQVPALSFSAQASESGSISADALFGDAPNERVALVGTSFSRNAHFADFLSQALATEAGNLAKDGGGFALSMAELLEQDIKQGSPTPWVIWEITERALQEPLQAIDHDLTKQ
ncbi:MAG: cell division protein FtsQ [Halothiobacillaceae bacterium]|nr:MAG: cell division protein FtsQ [Halothiobacillaceae bacterium]